MRAYRRGSAALIATWLAAWMLGSHVHAQPNHEVHRALRDDATLRSVAFHQGSVGWCVGDRGVILRTEDGGRRWQPQESGVTCRLECVGCLDDQRAWAAGGWIEPFTRASRGVLLWTDDGGNHWRVLRGDLPYLRWAHFANDKQITVAGDWSPRFLASVFESSDGGMAWSPVPQDIGPVVQAAQGEIWLGISRWGELVRRQGARIEPFGRLPAKSVIGIYADVMSVAAGPQVLASRFPESLTPLQQDQPMPLVAEVIAPGPQGLFIGGFPAHRSVVLGTQAPPAQTDPGFAGCVHAAGWISEHELVVAGSFGAIARSEDHGRTWTVVRGADRHAANLLIAQRPEQIPWMIAATESLQRAARTVVWVQDDADARHDDPLWPGMAALVDAAADEAGVCEMVMSGGGEADEMPMLEALLQSYRPLALAIAPGFDPARQTPLMAQAIQTSNGLRIWGVGANQSDLLTIDPAAAIPRSGALAGNYQQRAQAWINHPFHSVQRSSWTCLNQGAYPVHHADSLCAGILATGQNGSQRRVPAGTGFGVARLQAQLQFPSIVERLFEHARTDPARLRMVLAQQLPKLSPEDRETLALQLLVHCVARQEHGLWLETLKQLAETTRDAPVGVYARQTVQRIQRSREWRDSLLALPSALNTTPTTMEGRTAGQSPFEVVDGSSPSAASHAITRTSNQSAPVALQPAAMRPGDEHLVDAFQLQSPTAAQGRLLEPLSQSPSAGPWRMRALDLIDPRLPVDHCRILSAAGNRPHLDGVLSDAIWSSAGPLPEEPFVRMAYDGEFLFVAAAGWLTPTAMRPTRTRDEDLDHDPRWVMELDTDRDLCTSFRLEIDAAGRTRDSCDGLTAWQPMWFVAVGNTGSRWTVELAIRRQDLVALPPVAGDRWFLRTRSIPGGQCLPIGPEANPCGWRVAAFE